MLPIAGAAGPREEAFKTALDNYRLAIASGSRESIKTTAKEALEIGDQLYGTTHENTAVLAFNYAKALMPSVQARVNQTIVEASEQALSRFESVYGEASESLLPALTHHAHVLAARLAR